MNKVYIKKFFFFLFFFLIFLFIFFLWREFFLPFEDDFFFSIPKGKAVQLVSRKLEEEKRTRSWIFPYLFFRLTKKGVKSGVYKAEKGENLFHFLSRLSRAEYGDVFVRVTFPEGMSVSEYATLLKKRGLIRNEYSFVSKARDWEGMLFPDTYLFLPQVDEEKIIQVMKERFDKKFQEARKGSKFSHLHDYEAIRMASLIEKEAGPSLKEKQIISGILWKRISHGIPLQVDAPFLYERGKGSAELTKNDLLEDSKFNTYTRRGLPPSAISNPGYDALYAAFHPIESEYWYYLHGKDGKIHYAKTYKEHLKNKRLYLQ